MPPPRAADPTRDTALFLLQSVFDRHRTLEDALGQLPPTEARDRAAGHRLAAGVLRRTGSLDAVLEPFLRRAPPVAVRHVLRIGAASLLLGDTPPHAAVATAVELARRQGLDGFCPLVNAVLRRVAQAGAGALDELDGPRLDTPAWLWSSWGAAARDIALAHQVEAPLDLSLNPRMSPNPLAALVADVSSDAEPGHASGVPGAGEAGAPADADGSRGSAAGGRAGVRSDNGPAASPEMADAPGGTPSGRWLPGGTLRLPAGTRVSALPGFAEGAGWVQDAAASLPARLLGVRPGERVADLCAAPGGKTAQLVAAGAEVVAVERDPVRLERLRDNLLRLGLPARLLLADAADWRPDAPFDAVLLDAPCTATGTARRHPDVLRLKRPGDVATLVAGQRRLLAAAAAMLRPGGRLVYATCSLQPEEGAGQLAFAASLGLRHDPFEARELPGLAEARTGEGCLRTHPGLWPALGGLDGFFAARFVRP